MAGSRKSVRIKHNLAAQSEARDAVAEKQRYAEKEHKKPASQLKGGKRKRKEEDSVIESGKSTTTSSSAKVQTKSKKAKPNKKLPPLPLIKRCGSYRIDAPDVSNGWDCGGELTLELALSSTGGHVWGSFDFGVFEGTLRSRSAVTATDRTIKFHWRGRESGEGETTYGPENIAEFEFTGGGKFTGTMYWDCLGSFKLTGLLEPGLSSKRGTSDPVPNWKEDYWSINDASYTAASTARWGGWSSYEDGDGRVSNSDTDGQREDEHGDDDEDDEDEDDDDEIEGGNEDGIFNL